MGQKNTHPDSLHQGYFSFAIAAAPEILSYFDIFLLHEKSGRPTLYTAKDNGLSEQELARLSRQGVDRLFVPIEQHPTYREILLNQLDDLFFDDEITQESRCFSIRKLAIDIIEEALHPDQHLESYLTVIELGQHMARWIKNDQNRFGALLDLSDYSFTLTTHLYNTGIFSGILASKAFPDEIEMHAQAFAAGFLHDIALAAVPHETFVKQGTLSTDEWHDINAHPFRGFNLLKDCPGIPEGILACVHDHHERLDGGGYPRGISGHAIEPLTMFVVVTDTFDSIRASRVNRPGLHPLDAMDAMFEGLSAHFPQRPAMIWQQILHDSMQDFPARINQTRTPAGSFTSGGHLGRLLQVSPQGMRTYAPYQPPKNPSGLFSDERRASPRVQFHTSLKAVVLHHGKLSSSTIGQEVLLISIEISRTGIQVITPWAFSRGDIFILHLPKPAGKTIQQRAHVVRVRQREDGNWIAGMEFLTHAQMPKNLPAA
jgi:HD-GYP domain-containing protein (c-di-GMP phosphodiesterase class II)